MPTTVSNLIQIGELSKSSGLSVKTIRYYEDLGLIHAVKRSRGGFRLFEQETTLMRLQFIKQAQHLGMSLEEIGEILKVRDRGELPCHEVKQKLQDKVTEIDQQIQALQHLQTQIKSLLAGADPILETPEDDRVCPIIQPK
ncbi:transcriptional regulator, MerR family [Halothece sp. PCC 7418]|uniref:heavy metal-responsive transcriptional regulator n=1 Tax=Halothece sp. (strain PCC 7418) TaxID=65093 RepID=UPI0002A05BC1|nr:heavy metal-responsive transcriptional regulator [Halothece sp. PCC 7418]AFZ43884.1 transcriptional regulator, MerR family [Halothece sp. PCC 7418]